MNNASIATMEMEAKALSQTSQRPALWNWRMWFLVATAALMFLSIAPLPSLLEEWQILAVDEDTVAFARERGGASRIEALDVVTGEIRTIVPLIDRECHQRVISVHDGKSFAVLDHGTLWMVAIASPLAVRSYPWRDTSEGIIGVSSDEEYVIVQRAMGRNMECAVVALRSGGITDRRADCTVAQCPHDCFRLMPLNSRQSTVWKVSATGKLEQLEEADVLEDALPTNMTTLAASTFWSLTVLDSKTKRLLYQLEKTFFGIALQKWYVFVSLLWGAISVAWYWLAARVGASTLAFFDAAMSACAAQTSVLCVVAANADLNPTPISIISFVALFGMIASGAVVAAWYWAYGKGTIVTRWLCGVVWIFAMCAPLATYLSATSLFAGSFALFTFESMVLCASFVAAFVLSLVIALPMCAGARVSGHRDTVTVGNPRQFTVGGLIWVTFAIGMILGLTKPFLEIVAPSAMAAGLTGGMLTLLALESIVLPAVVFLPLSRWKVLGIGILVIAGVAVCIALGQVNVPIAMTPKLGKPELIGFTAGLLLQTVLPLWLLRLHGFRWVITTRKGNSSFLASALPAS